MRFEIKYTNDAIEDWTVSESKTSRYSFLSRRTYISVTLLTTR